MNFTDRAAPDRKSGGAKWRDLLFYRSASVVAFALFMSHCGSLGVLLSAAPPEAKHDG